MPKQAIIVLAHGSRNMTANQEVEDLAMSLNTLQENDSICSFAFLELTEPSLHQTVDRLNAMGVNNIRVLPYFLVSGNHVQKDIPELVGELSNHYPKMTISILPAIGHSHLMLDLLQQHLKEYTQ